MLLFGSVLLAGCPRIPFGDPYPPGARMGAMLDGDGAIVIVVATCPGETVKSYEMEELNSRGTERARLLWQLHARQDVRPMRRYGSLDIVYGVPPAGYTTTDGPVADVTDSGLPTGFSGWPMGQQGMTYYGVISFRMGDLRHDEIFVNSSYFESSYVDRAEFEQVNRDLCPPRRSTTTIGDD